MYIFYPITIIILCSIVILLLFFINIMYSTKEYICIDLVLYKLIKIGSSRWWTFQKIQRILYENLNMGKGNSMDKS